MLRYLEIFRKFTFFTLCTVYVLILLGSTVRVSDSGMGCPDWPTCFGRLVPPTSEDQLPPNYREIYAHKKQLLEKFNATKTWTEYLNRLFGFIVGIMILITFILSIKLKKVRPKVFYFSLLTLLLVIAQGFLGAMVVATNLLPGMITIHMILALVIISTLIYVGFSSHPNTASTAYNKTYSSYKLYYPSLLLFILTTVQILMGAQVREMIDFANKITPERSQWISYLGDLFYVHRSFSWLIILGNLWFLQKISKSLSHPNKFFRRQLLISLLIILQALSGSLLNHLDFPILLQPAHLLVSTIILGLQLNLLLHLKRQRTEYLLSQNFV